MIGRKLNGRPKFKSIYGNSYSNVKRRLVILKSKHIQNGEKTVLVYEDGTLSDWMDYWLEVLERPYIRDTTYLLYKRNIDNHLKTGSVCL